MREAYSVGWIHLSATPPYRLVVDMVEVGAELKKADLRSPERWLNRKEPKGD